LARFQKNSIIILFLFVGARNKMIKAFIAFNLKEENDFAIEQQNKSNL